MSSAFGRALKFLPVAAVLMVAGALLFNVSASSKTAKRHAARPTVPRVDAKLYKQGKQVFRYDTFGDEAYWSGQLQLDKAIEGAKNGGVGPGVSPKTALAVGLKVDANALPKAVVNGIKKGKVDLNDPKTTLALLKLNAVVGVQGRFNRNGSLRSIGLTCAVCHSTVNNSFAPGIGKRLDGWPNQDLNVGQIVSLAPNLKPLTDALGVDEATVKKVLASWGPGKFDAELNLDGKAFRPDGKPAATRIPAAYGHLGQDLHTWTGGFGDVTYWNAYVANPQMHGKANFNDSRLNDPVKYPVATRAGKFRVRHTPDLVTPKLAPLHYYQLALPAPKPPASSYDHAAAARGERVFNGQGRCADCHMPPLYTDAGYNAHKPAEICTDSFQADRGPAGGTYVTPQLAGLWARSKRGFYHDGRHPTLGAVVTHYNSCFGLNLSARQQSDLVQFLKSL
jgi:mono/diheme cytochrome c family protein